MIEIKVVDSQKDLRSFIQFPMDLYRDNPYYVPPFIKEELNMLDRNKNPIFKSADSQYFLAYKGKEVVGRMAAMINWTEVKEQKKNKLRFGWYDTKDDLAITQKLVEAASAWGREKGMEFMEGPVGFSNLEKAGLLTKGFDKVATMVTLYNHPYYAEHLEKLGFEKASEWVEYYFDMPKVLPEKVVKFTKIVSERYGLQPKRFSKTKEIMPYVDDMFRLLDKTYGHLSSYVPFTEKQIEHYKKKYIPFIHPSFVLCIVDKNDDLMAFAITMPSYSAAMQKAKGKLFPMGLYHLWRASKKNDKAAFYLIGIDPKYQGKGVTSIVFSEMQRAFTNFGVEYVETNPELEENTSVQVLWRSFGPVNHKRRRSYRKDL